MVVQVEAVQFQVEMVAAVGGGCCLEAGLAAALGLAAASIIPTGDRHPLRSVKSGLVFEEKRETEKGRAVHPI